MMDITFSIILPVYNKEEFVAQAIESVLNQEYKNLELIVINDGSTDNSLYICEGYKHQDARVTIINQENSGLSKSRNVGIEKSNGKYIIFLDADDYLEKNCLSTFINYEEEIEDIFICSFKRIFPNGNSRIFNRFKNLYPKVNGSGQLILKEMYETNIYESSVWTNIYGREFINKNNLFFTNGLIHEDEEWLIKALLIAKRVKVLDMILYNTRAGVQNSIINSINYKKNISKILISDNILKFISNVKFEDTELEKILKLGMTSFYIKAVIGCNIFNNNERKDILKLAREKKYILKNVVSIKQKLVKIIFDILGLDNGSKILNKVMK